MALVHDELKCGGCGGSSFKLTNIRGVEDGRDTFRRIRAKCTKCESISEIAVTSTITVSNIFGDGTLCGGWPVDIVDGVESGEEEEEETPAAAPAANPRVANLLVACRNEKCANIEYPCSMRNGFCRSCQKEKTQ